MKWFKELRELKDGIPDARETYLFLLKAGAIISLMGSAHLIGTFFSDEPDRWKFFLVAIGLMVAGILFLWSSYGIKNKKEWAKNTTISSICILMFSVSACFIPPSKMKAPDYNDIYFWGGVVFVFLFGVLPFYLSCIFGIRYMVRLYRESFDANSWQVEEGGKEQST